MSLTLQARPPYSEKRSNKAWRTIGNWMAVGLVALGACGCSVVETRGLPEGSLSPWAGCSSALGGYFLPKTNLHVTLIKSEAERPFLTVEPQKVADRRGYFCLDYLSSWTSQDNLTVERNQEGVLKSVKAETNDKSSSIADTAINAWLRGATGSSTITNRSNAQIWNSEKKELVVDLSFDPFNEGALSEVNRALANPGNPAQFCILLDQTVDPNTYCSHPPKRPALVQGMGSPPVRLNMVEDDDGILYRPNQTYQISIFQFQKDPNSKPAEMRGKWLLSQTRQEQFPNQSPLISVAMDRSYFVDRKSTLTFDHGVLTNVKMDKPSEAGAFSQIPLKVVSAIAAVPGELFRVRLQAVNNEKELIDVQREQITTQLKYNDTLKELQGLQPPTSNNDNRSLAERVSEQKTGLERKLDGACNETCFMYPSVSNCREQCASYARERCTSGQELTTCLGNFTPE